MNRVLVVILAIFFLFIGGMEIICKNQVDAYRGGNINSSTAINGARIYIGIRSSIPFFKSDGYAIANSYLLARVTTPEYQENVKNSATAMGDLLRIVRKENANTNIWINEAAYQALIILNSLPWDESLQLLSIELTQVLARAIEGQENSEEVLAIRGEIEVQKSRALITYKNNFEEVELNNDNKNWLQRVINVRVNMAKCSAKSGEANANAWTLLNDGFGMKWLAVNSMDGLDFMRIQLVKLVSNDENCLKYVSRYESMIKAAKIGSNV